MTPKEFFDKVVEMRRCQKEYLKNKRQIDLRISKQIEREVDKEIELIAKNRTEMKKILIICVLFALIAGCASPRNSVENHPAKNSPQPDALPDNKENRFTKQFQQADSMFNQKYLLE